MLRARGWDLTAVSKIAKALKVARKRRKFADGGDVDWSRMNQLFGELKGTAPEDTPVCHLRR